MTSSRPARNTFEAALVLLFPHAEIGANKAGIPFYAGTTEEEDDDAYALAGEWEADRCTVERPHWITRPGSIA